MKSKKTIIIIATLVVVVTAAAALLASALVRDFDAEKYVSVVLNQTFKGDVKGATEIIEGATEEELMKQYEDGVTSFVKNMRIPRSTRFMPLSEQLRKISVAFELQGDIVPFLGVTKKSALSKSPVALSSVLARSSVSSSQSLSHVSIA